MNAAGFRYRLDCWYGGVLIWRCRWTLDILPIFMLLGFAEKCVLLCHLCPQRFSRPRRSPNAFGLGQMQKGKTHPTQGRRRNTSKHLSVRATSDGVAFAWARETEAQNAGTLLFFVFSWTSLQCRIQKKHTQDFRIAHRCSLGRPLNWSHLQSCKSFHHISSLFVVCSQTKKTRGTIHHCKEKPISWL